MEKETSTNVVKKEKGGALAASIFESDAAAGLSNIGHEDLALPFLKILGQLSPETNKRDGKYVEGAEPGMIYNSVTGDICRAPAGALQISRGADYKDRLPSGNYVEKTASHFIIVAEKNPSTALIAMKSTQLKVSRKWNSMMQSIKLKGKNGLFTPASFSHIYNLRSVQQSNDKGTWFGWDISKVGMVEDASLYQQAKKFYESVSKGDVEVKHGGETSAKTDDHM